MGWKTVKPDILREIKREIATWVVKGQSVQSCPSSPTQLHIMAACTGKYKLTHSDNFEEFMKALGVGLVTRKLGNKSSPVVTITENAGEFTMKQESLVKTSEIKFRIGQEFDEVTADGRQGKSWEPNIWFYQILRSNCFCFRQFWLTSFDFRNST